MMKKSPLIP